MLCTEIVSDIQNNFCTQHVLPKVLQKEELLTKIYLYTGRQNVWSGSPVYEVKCLCPEGRNERRRVSTPTSFLIFDSYAMKSFQFRFGHGNFTGLETVSWNARFSAVTVLAPL